MRAAIDETRAIASRSFARAVSQAAARTILTGDPAADSGKRLARQLELDDEDSQGSSSTATTSGRGPRCAVGS